MSDALSSRENYLIEIDRIIRVLEKDIKDSSLLDRIQGRLDSIASKYQHDASLGTEKYKLYQAQAMLCLRKGDYEASREWIEASIYEYGGSYDSAEEMLVFIEKNRRSEFDALPPESRDTPWSRYRQRWLNEKDDMVDFILMIFSLPLYGLAIFLPFAGIGSILDKEYRSGVLYFLSALSSYVLANGIEKYFDIKRPRFQ